MVAIFLTSYVLMFGDFVHCNTYSNNLSLLVDAQLDRVKGIIISLNHEHELNADKIPDPSCVAPMAHDQTTHCLQFNLLGVLYSPDVSGNCEDCDSLIVIPCFNKLSLLRDPQWAQCKNGVKQGTLSYSNTKWQPCSCVYTQNYAVAILRKLVTM